MALPSPTEAQKTIWGLQPLASAMGEHPAGRGSFLPAYVRQSLQAWKVGVSV